MGQTKKSITDLYCSLGENVWTKIVLCYEKEVEDCIYDLGIIEHELFCEHGGGQRTPWGHLRLRTIIVT